jgi:hypothetical protein
MRLGRSELAAAGAMSLPDGRRRSYLSGLRYWSSVGRGLAVEFGPRLSRAADCLSMRLGGDEYGRPGV